MRYQTDEQWPDEMPKAQTSPGMLGSTVVLALAIGVLLLYLGHKGKQLWLVVWSIGLVVCSVLYLGWHVYTYFIP